MSGRYWAPNWAILVHHCRGAVILDENDTRIDLYVNNNPVMLQIRNWVR